jgi:hypothetical protein
MMARRIRRLFHGTGGDRALIDGARALGRLATWWLDDAAVQRVRGYPGQESLLQPPSLRRGEFLALFETKATGGWIDDAFGLPLEWRRETMPDPRLPASLREVAATAPRTLTSDKERTESDSWRLYLGEGCPDLSDFIPCELPAESAGAIVHAALRCCIRGAMPALDVTASAAIGPYGIDVVSGLDSKLNAARRLCVKRLFVAPAQEYTKVADVNVVPTKEVARSAQLDEIACALDAPPVDGSFEERRDWYNRTAGQGSPNRVSFYAEYLVRDLAALLRATSELPDLDTLVICAGRIVEPILLAAETMRAERVILLHTDDGEDSATNRSTAYLQQLSRSPRVETVHFPRHATESQLHALLHGALREDERVGVDITPGPKDIALYLERLCRNWKGLAPCTCTYMTSHTENGRALYGVSDRITVLYPDR